MICCGSSNAVLVASPSANVLVASSMRVPARQERYAAGAASDELLPSQGNWGRFTFTLSRGHWWQTARPSTAPGWTAYGSYVVAGHKVTFYRHDHDYQGSDTEIWGPYIWSVYRDALTFQKAGWTGSTQGPTGLAVRPWRRTGM